MITDTILLLKVIRDMQSRGARVVLQAALLNHTIGYSIMATFPKASNQSADTVIEVTVCHNLNEGPD